MTAISVFLFGLAVLALFFFYFGADDDRLKRRYGTILGAVVTAFCVYVFIAPKDGQLIETLTKGNQRGEDGRFHNPPDKNARPTQSAWKIWSRFLLEAKTGAVPRDAIPVRRLDRAGGRITGVYTEQGRIACEQVVVAGGAWSSLFLRAEGVTIPQLSVLASVAQTEAMPEVFAGNAADENFAFRRRQDGGYTIAPGQHHDFFIGPDAFRNLAAYLPVLKKDFRSTHFRPAAPAGFPDAWTTKRRWSPDGPSPFERIRVLNPRPNMQTIARTQAAFAAAFPGLGRPRLRAAWGGMIDTMPDVVPVIDRAPIEGLVIATGLSGHGFGIGPGLGRVVADIVRGRAPGHDLTRFRLSRFRDGSSLQVARGL